MPVIISNTGNQVVHSQADGYVVQENNDGLVLTLGIQGPAGPQGEQGIQGIPGEPASTYLSYIAGESLGAHRAVIISNNLAFYADNSTLGHVNRVVGVTVNAVGVGQEVQIQALGELSGFTGLTEGLPLFLGFNGTLVQTISNPLISQIIGVAISDTVALINIQQAILMG